MSFVFKPKMLGGEFKSGFNLDVVYKDDFIPFFTGKLERSFEEEIRHFVELYFEDELRDGETDFLVPVPERNFVWGMAMCLSNPIEIYAPSKSTLEGITGYKGKFLDMLYKSIIGHEEFHVVEKLNKTPDFFLFARRTFGSNLDLVIANYLGMGRTKISKEKIFEEFSSGIRQGISAHLAELGEDGARIAEILTLVNSGYSKSDILELEEMEFSQWYSKKEESYFRVKRSVVKNPDYRSYIPENDPCGIGIGDYPEYLNKFEIKGIDSVRYDLEDRLNLIHSLL